MLGVAAPWRPVDVLSLGLLVAMHAASAFVLFVPFSCALVALAVGGYALRMFAITAGYHRYFSHRAFKTSRAFQFFLGLLGTTSMQNGPLWWASWHRRHHKHADTGSDPHSPRHGGFWRSHLGWVIAPEEAAARDLSNVKDLSRFRELQFLDDHKWLPLVGYALACFAIAGLPGVVWGFVVSTVVLFHGTLLINSMAHVWGSRRPLCQRDVRQLPLDISVPMGGEWFLVRAQAFPDSRPFNFSLGGRSQAA